MATWYFTVYGMLLLLLGLLPYYHSYRLLASAGARCRERRGGGGSGRVVSGDMKGASWVGGWSGRWVGAWEAYGCVRGREGRRAPFEWCA